MQRLLIVNADDMGLHEDINRGIHMAHTEGIVTSASLVACGEAFDHGAAIIKDCRELDVGVHLTLIEERPLSSPNDIPSLVGTNGDFLPSYRQFIARALMGLVSAAEVRHELEAQIERVIATGRRPSHLDSHQHIHLLPIVWNVTKELARKYGIRWIRLPHFGSLIACQRSPFDPFFRLGLNILSAAKIGLSSGVKDSVHTVGLHLSGKLNEAEMLGMVGTLRPGISEIVAHPGIKSTALSARYHWNYEWSTELAALTSSRIISSIRSSGISLTRFSDC